VTNVYFSMIAVPLILLFAILAAQKMGMKLRQRHHVGADDMEGLGVIDAAVFGLMGLLLAMAFSSATARFDERRKLVIQESNDVGTAWLRIALLPSEDQPRMKELFRAYVDIRIATYAHFSDIQTIEKDLAGSAALQNEIWALAVASASKAPSTTASMLLLPALNAMFDTCSTRVGAMRIHSPGPVFGLLIGVMLLASALAGYRFGSSGNWTLMHRISFALVLAITYYVIVDLEYPRLGWIRVDDIDVMLQQVRQSMG
jgi:hypothetical protein